MFVRAKLKVLVGEKRLMLPSSALIYTGKRYIVFVSPGKGKFIPRVVRPGQQIGDYTIVHSGVQEGESVVVSANFLLDSEAQGKGYFREPGESSTIGSHQH
ncbi:MAG: efflux RND transporter periplasmic adaptor subunit, partial [Spirochaetota bacterium]|nr:efflux RND transporter periplasmic adaptor subunit [Spirochaetota bacterium]